MIACFYLQTEYNYLIATVVFIIAYITDIIDGWYARKYNMITDFGKLMDPMADKLLTAGAIIMLNSVGKLNPIYTFIIIGREFVVSAVRLVAASEGNVIAAGVWGKLKTISQAIAIPLIMLDNPIFRNINVPFDMIVMTISVILSIWSAIDYIYKYIRGKKYGS